MNIKQECIVECCFFTPVIHLRHHYCWTADLWHREAWAQLTKKLALIMLVANWKVDFANAELLTNLAKVNKPSTFLYDCLRFVFFHGLGTWKCSCRQWRTTRTSWSTNVWLPFNHHVDFSNNKIILSQWMCWGSFLQPAVLSAAQCLYFIKLCNFQSYSCWQLTLSFFLLHIVFLTKC